MIKAIESFFLDTLGREWCVFFCSMLPVIELRGSVPLGIMALHMPWWQVYLISVVGNLIPVPFILLFIRALLGWMKKIPHLDRIAVFIEERAQKGSEKVKQRASWGLFIFVAIPLPGTGAWTGAMIAAMLDVRMRYALPAIAAGVMVAGLIMMAIAGGLFGFLSFLLP